MIGRRDRFLKGVPGTTLRRTRLMVRWLMPNSWAIVAEVFPSRNNKRMRRWTSGCFSRSRAHSSRPMATSLGVAWAAGKLSTPPEALPRVFSRLTLYFCPWRRVRTASVTLFLAILVRKATRSSGVSNAYFWGTSVKKETQTSCTKSRESNLDRNFWWRRLRTARRMCGPYNA